MIRSCDIGTDETIKNRIAIYDSLKQYVAVMFSVVVAVGLCALEDANKAIDYVMILAAYLVIFLSWYGYHMGTIKGDRESNILNYVIDCILITVYWFLIREQDFLKITGFYFFMYILYALWEYVRYVSNTNSQNLNYIYLEAAKFNLAYSFHFPVLYFLYSFYITGPPVLLKVLQFVFLIVIVVLIIIYRKKIGTIYGKDRSINDNESIEQASEINKLIQISKNAALNARVPYSNYKVGAAILTQSGRIYSGCNIEFGNYSNTIHAEESAIVSMISSGANNPKSIAVYTEDDKVQFPCGMCLQSLIEIGGPDLKVIAVNQTSQKSKTMKELMPEAFLLKE